MTNPMQGPETVPVRFEIKRDFDDNTRKLLGTVIGIVRHKGNKGTVKVTGAGDRPTILVQVDKKAPWRTMVVPLRAEDLPKTMRNVERNLAL